MLTFDSIIMKQYSIIMSTPPFEQTPNEDPEQFDFETVEFATLSHSMGDYYSAQDNYVEAVGDALHSTDPSSKSRKSLLSIDNAKEQYVMAFDAILYVIIDSDETIERKLIEITSIVKHDVENRDYFTKHVLASTEFDEDDDIEEEFDEEEFIRSLQDDLENLGDLTQLHISMVDSFSDELDHSYILLLEKYMKQQANIDEAVNEIIFEIGDSEHGKEYEADAESSTLNRRLGKHALEIGKTAFGVAGGILVAKFIQSHLYKN